MVQVKKTTVRDAILASAFAQFSKHGYANTSLSAIAAHAGITTSNIYRYYHSKLEILYSVFGPWITAHLDQLEKRVSRMRSPRDRLRAILLTLWRDIPRADNGFNNNLIQALAIATPSDGYSRKLLLRLEKRVSALILANLPARHRRIAKGNFLIHALFMAADGFAMNAKLNGPTPSITALVDFFCDLLINAASSEDATRRFET